jgi:hypothetical protein
MVNRLMKSGGGIDYGLDEGPPLDSMVGSASTKN